MTADQVLTRYDTEGASRFSRQEVDFGDIRDVIRHIEHFNPDILHPKRKKKKKNKNKDNTKESESSRRNDENAEPRRRHRRNSRSLRRQLSNRLVQQLGKRRLSKADFDKQKNYPRKGKIRKLRRQTCERLQAAAQELFKGSLSSPEMRAKTRDNEEECPCRLKKPGSLRRG